MRPIELSPRLRSVGELVPPGSRYADVGTDHAYLPVWLLQNGVVDRAIVSDLRESPLDRARQTGERYGFTERLDFRLCDGLGGFGPDDADTISIAGMGGETIAAILEACPWAKTGERRYILQPMSAAEDLRAYLSQNGFTVLREVLTKEGRTLYVTLLAAPGADTPYTPAELWAGRQTHNAPLRGEYLDKLLRRAAAALAGARVSNKAEDRARAEEFRAVYHGLTNMKKEWDTWQR